MQTKIQYYYQNSII